MISKERIIFFGSGDFPRHTFLKMCKEQQLDSSKFEVIGLVTSFDKCEDGGKTLKEIATEYNIPFLAVKTCKDDTMLLDWCKSLKPTMFVVISFKKIPKELLDIVNGRAFNVHASLLPLLRGANPIRWAIRHSLKETGLTAINLAEEIDSGSILANFRMPILRTDNYGTLKESLASICQSFAIDVINNYDNYIPIRQSNCGSNALIFEAPKLDKNYYKLYNGESPENLLRSLAPYDGLKCRILVDERVPSGVFKIGFKYQRVKILNCKVWKIHEPQDGEDTKHFLMSHYMNTPFVIDEIQLEGKKRMAFKDFLNGFKYAKPQPNDDKYDERFKKYHFTIGVI